MKENGAFRAKEQFYNKVVTVFVKIFLISFYMCLIE